MLRRANDLVARARERIRAAAEHDPHAWHHHPGDHDRNGHTPDEPVEPIDFVQIPDDDDDTATRPPEGSP